MKKLIIRTIGLGLAFGLTIALTDSAVAQQGKGNKQAAEATEVQEAREKNQQARGNKDNTKADQKENKKEEKQERVQRDRAQAQGKQDRQQADDAGEGNAYGREKGDMSGREFGQNKAAEARLTGEQRKAQLVTAVDEGDSKVKEARDRIAKAKDELEKNRRSGRISDAEVDERRAAIERAENAVRVLEERVNAGRAKLQR